jgi:hypothetical protein
MAKRKRDPWDDPEVRRYLARANKELRPMVQKSRVTVALWTGDPDAKQAIELGFMILYDKPIIILAEPGQVIPAKLAAVADEIIFGGPGDQAAVDKLSAAMTRIVGVVVEDPDES